MAGMKRASKPDGPSIQGADITGNGDLSHKKKKKKKTVSDVEDRSDGRNHAAENENASISPSRKKKKKKNKEVVATGTEQDLNLHKSKRRRLAAEVSEPKGLEIYWKLPSVDPNERQAAALALVKELQAAQQAFEAKDGKVENGAETILLGEEHNDSLKSCAPELQYALPRLVRGVGSSNQCARQGFASALTVVLATIPSVTADSVLKLIDKEIEVSSMMKGQELKDGLIGKLFAYASIVRAGRLIGEAVTVEQQELAKKVVNELLSLALKKRFLREPAISVFLELSGQLPVEPLESVCSLPLFEELLTASPEVGGAEVLAVALKLWLKLPDSLWSKCCLLPKSRLTKDIFQTSHLQILIPYLKESSSCHPRVHPVWGILAEIFSDPSLFHSHKKKSKRKNEDGAGAAVEQCLMTFWSLVVDDALLGSSHERKYLAMRVVLIFLSRLPVSCAPIILSIPFGRCFLDILSAHTNHLYNFAQQFLSDLCQWAEQDQDRLVFTIAFLQQISFGKFDRLTKSSIVKQLMSKVTSEASCLLAIRNLQRLFVIDSSNGGNESDDATVIFTSRKISMVDMMSVFGKQASAISNSRLAMKEVTRFLAAHLFLETDAVNADKLKALVKFAPGPFPKGVKDECAVKLRALLSEKLSHRKEATDDTEDLGYDLVEFFQPAWRASKGTLQQKLQAAISQITSAIKKAENASRLRAMRSLLSQLFIQSILEPGTADEIVTELLICCKKEFGKVVNISVDMEVEDSDEAPQLPDVLLDVVLSIMSQSSAPVRTAAEQLFGFFCAEITQSGLNSMLKVISKQIGHNRGESIFEQDDDDDDVVSVEDVEGEDEDKEGSEDSCVEEEEDIGGTAKQQADEDGSEGAMDSDELSDMDDEAMFRMDGHLAQILRERKKGETDAQGQLLQFKFRVLGLLETFLHKQPEHESLLTVLAALFQAYLHAASDGNRQLCDRIDVVLIRTFKAKSHPKGSELDMATLKDLLEMLLRLAARTTDQRTRILTQGFVFWVLKVSQGSADKEVEQIMSTVVDDVLQRKKSNLPLSFFQECSVRYPWLGRILIGKFIDRCRLARTDCAKVEAMNLVSSILKLQAKSTATSDDFASSLQPHLPQLSEVMILYFREPLKKRWRIAFVRFCIACLEALLVLYQGQHLSKLVDTSDLSAAVAGFKHEEGKLKPLRAKLESLLQQQQQQAGEGNSSKVGSSKKNKKAAGK